MATEQVGTLTARLVADVEGFRADMAKAQRQLASNTAKMNRALATTNKQLGGLSRGMATFGKAVALVGGAAVLGRMVRGIINAGLEMQALERRFQTVTQDAALARREFGFVSSEADRLGLNLRVAAQNFSSFAAAARGTSLQGQATRDIFTATAEATRVLNLSAADTEGVFRALEQIVSKGRVSAEELRQQLGERLPGAFQIAARSIGVTTAELDNLLRRGELTADELLPKMAEELRKTFGPDVENAANDAQAAFNRFNNAIFELSAGIAESGILDKLGDLANFGARAARAMGDFFRLNETDLQAEIRELSTWIDLQREMLRHGLATADQLERINAAIERLIELRAKVNRNREIGESGLAEVFAPSRGLLQFRDREPGPPDAGLRHIDAAGIRGRADQIAANAAKNAAAFATARASMAEANQALVEMQDNTARAQERMQAFGNTMVNGFAAAILRGQEFSDVLKSIAIDLLVVAAREQLTKAFATGGFFGGAAPAQHGGRFDAGEARLVGEAGPEVIVPGFAGAIIPIRAGGRGGVNITNNNDFRGADSSAVAQILAHQEAVALRTKAEIREEMERKRL